MNNLYALLLFVVVLTVIFLVIVFWSACALGKKSDELTENAVIRMMEDQRNITSGSAVIRE